MLKKVTIAPTDISDEQWKKGRTLPFRGVFATGYLTPSLEGRSGVPPTGTKVFSFLFSKDMKIRTLIFPDCPTGELGYKIFMENPQLDHPENKNVGKKDFIVVDYEKATISGVELLKKIIIVLNKINNFSEREKRDVAFFMGENPVDKSDGELLLMLVNLKTGVLITGVQANGESNLDYFLAKFNGDTDAQITIVVKKAIHFNIIENKDRLFYIGAQAIGSTIDELVVYCKNNMQMYENFVLKQVQSKDIMANESYPEVDPIKIEETENAELAGLQARAAELKIQGHALMKDPDKIKLAILKKEKELLQISNNEKRNAEILRKSNETDALADK